MTEGKLFTFRFDDDTEKILDILAEKENKSKTEIVKQALYHYANCTSKEGKNEPSLKLIITKFDGSCSKCKAHIPIGSFAYYGKGDNNQTILICMDCIVQNKSDRALVSRYLKMRELDKLIKALRREAEYYASKLDKLQVFVKFDTLYAMNDQIVNLTKDYLMNTPVDKDKEKEKLEEIMSAIEKNKILTRDIEEFINNHIRFERPRKPDDKAEA